MSGASRTRILLARRPVGAPVAADFRIETAALPQPGPGEVLVRVLYLSLDPYMRGRMSEAKSYAPPVALGDVMVGETVAEIVQSNVPGFPPGDIVRCHAGWQSHAALPADRLQRVDATVAPVSTALGVLGMPGFSAWVGLDAIGRPQQGETLVVAAATGPVGATVGQVARLRGARCVGIAGGARKCAALIEEFGFAAAIDHRAPDFAPALARACPDGIDVYFENVGGAVFDAVLPLLNRFARVPVCGVVATYNDREADRAGPDRLPALMGAVLRRSLTVQGFINNSFIERYEAFHAEMSAWVRNGDVRTREDIIDGLANAPGAFIGMLEGRNFGKLLIRP
ncbi:NADP-dependent oxidoreductase [Lichenicoccus sp.]|uniref:NADP-dependent oxidoreductase n=1 Tax=Lichenicoccus sp. TaxID=2781899 RepID=UPI003D0F1040